MSSTEPMAPRLLLLWHMHQPAYRLPGDVCALMPWVRLHAAKSYLDMADALDRHPSVHAVVNFSGILLRQWRELLELGGTDEEERISLRPVAALDRAARVHIVTHFFSAHERVVSRFPRWMEIREQVRRLGVDRAADTLDGAALRDLTVLFALGWCGFALRRTDHEVQALEQRGRAFSDEDLVVVLRAHRRALHEARHLWRSLIERGQVELSITPMFHPILPLVIDTESARECMPGATLPERYRRPDHARWHIDAALEEARTFFGCEPGGMWPAEGSVSHAAASMFVEAGVQWIATDEAVLAASEVAPQGGPRCEAGPWRVETGEGRLDVFVRDHALSDRVGFVYAGWDADAAAEDLLRRVRARGPGSVTACILDGENAWESYHDDGSSFLDALYSRIEAGAVRSVLPAHLRAQEPVGHVQRLATGSWIDANFRIWIGSPQKNRAWTQLVRTVSELTSVGALANSDIAEHVHQAEGSDWFWWYGDDFTSVNDGRFDALFRGALERARALAGLSPLHAEEIDETERIGGRFGQEAPTLVAAPTVDGRQTDFYEWMGAESAVALLAGGAMAMHGRVFAEAVWGGYGGCLYVRASVAAREEVDAIVVWVKAGDAGEVRVEVTEGGEAEAHDVVALAWRDVLEVRVRVGGPGDERHQLRVDAVSKGVRVESMPRSGWYAVPASAGGIWFV